MPSQRALLLLLTAADICAALNPGPKVHTADIHVPAQAKEASFGSSSLSEGPADRAVQVQTTWFSGGHLAPFALVAHRVP